LKGRKTFTGQVVSQNQIKIKGKDISCWKNGMQEAIAPQPLDLSEYIGLIVKISGDLHGEIYNASLVRTPDRLLPENVRNKLSQILQIYQEATVTELLNDLVAIGTWPTPEKPGLEKGAIKKSMGSIWIDTVPIPDRPAYLKELLGEIVELTGKMKIKQII
jgi:hypothetical protein